jgi:hypothetical protein
MQPDCEEEVIETPVMIPIEVEINETDLSNETMVAAIGIEVDASTTEATENSVVSSDNTIHQLFGTQLLPPKLQDIINSEIEPDERILATNVRHHEIWCAPCNLMSMIGYLIMMMGYFVFPILGFQY